MSKLENFHQETNLSHLFEERSTTNYEVQRRFRCSKFRPCKRMSTCNECIYRRRCYFTERGALRMQGVQSLTHMTITWQVALNKCVWSILLNAIDKISRRMTGRLGRYIRVIAIGKRGAPHVHFLLSLDDAMLIKTYAHRQWESGIRLHQKPVSDIDGLLGYLFDQNFLTTVQRLDRPKRIRLISGSRGMSYGYPSKEEWQKYNQKSIHPISESKSGDLDE